MTMTTQILATDMKQGMQVQAHGALFTLGEVFNREGVYWSKGVCKAPSEFMQGSKAYFDDCNTGEWSWQFQGNKYRTLTIVN